MKVLKKIFLFCGCLLAAISVAQAQNLLSNGDLETWEAGAATEWNVNTTVASVMQSDPAAGVDGGYAAVVTTTEGYGAAFSQAVPWSQTTDKYVKLSVWLKLDASANANDVVFLQVEANAGNGGGSNRWTQTSEDIPTTLLSQTHYKQFYVVNRVAPEATSVEIRIAGASATKFLVDDVRLEIVDPFVTFNGDMEDVDEDLVPSNMTGTDETGGVSLAASTEGLGYGDTGRAMQMQASANYAGMATFYGVIWNDALTPLTCKLTAQVKMVPVDGSDTDTGDNVRLFMYQNDPWAFQADGEVDTIPIDGQWHSVTRYVTLPHNGSNFWLRLDFPEAGSDAVNCLVDNIAFEELPAVLPPEGNLILNGDFESASSGVLSNWQLAGSTVALQSGEGEGLGGSGKAALVTALAGYEAMYQVITWNATVDCFVQMDAWLKLDDSESQYARLFMQLEASPSNGGGGNRWTQDAQSTPVNLAKHDDYKRFSVLVRVQAGATQLIARIAGAGAAKFLVDRVEVKVVEAYQLVNGDMESIDEDGFPSNMMVTEQAGVELAASALGEGYGDQGYAAKLQASEDYAGLLTWYGTIWNDTNAPTSSTLMARVKALPLDAGDADSSEAVRLYMFDDSGTFQGDAQVSIVPIDGQWHVISRAVTIPLNSGWNFWFRLDCPQAGGDSVRLLVDDISLVDEVPAGPNSARIWTLY